MRTPGDCLAHLSQGQLLPGSADMSNAILKPTLTWSDWRTFLPAQGVFCHKHSMSLGYPFFFSCTQSFQMKSW